GAGYQRACAVLANGQVWCWGNGSYGNQGTGDVANHPMPTQVPGITDAVEISLSRYTTCVRRGASGVFNVTCWGYNSSGAVGIGTTTVQYNSPGTPVVGLPSNVSALASNPNNDSMCAITTDGLLFCWGSDSNSGLELPLGSNPSNVVTTAT